MRFRWRPNYIRGVTESDTVPVNDEQDASALVSRLRLIEDQPLQERAAALNQVHDELQSRLEAGDAPRAHA